MKQLILILTLALSINAYADLHGYFISEYTTDSKGKITFNDSGSLRMSIESDIKEYFNQFLKFNPIDEAD